MNALVAALALATAGVDPAVHPVDAAHADAAALAPAYRCEVRYLRLDEVPRKDRPAVVRVLNGHVQHLSTASEVVPLTVVPGTDDALLRLNLGDYGDYRRLRVVWDQFRSPFDHVLVERLEDEEWGYWQNGQWIRTEVKKTKKVRVPAIAPWLADTPERAAKLAELVGWLDGTKAPILRARWFFQQTAAAVDRTPNYYDFLGVKDEKTFQALIGFREQKNRRRIQVREAVGVSGVTLEPRGLVREDAEGGAYWYSLDFKVALDKTNPLRVLGDDIERAFRDPKIQAASEQYGHLPNGFWATGAFNNKGERQDTAPDFAASDNRSRSNDRRVHVNVSCVRCHRKAGLQDIDGWARNLFQPPLKLVSPDYDALRVLRQQYLRRLEPFLARDRRQYAEALLDANGMEPEAYADAYAALWEGYEDAGVDLARAAADLNTTPELVRKAIDRQIRIGGQVDPVLSVLLLEGERARRIPVRQWEEAVPLAHQILRGLQTP